MNPIYSQQFFIIGFLIAAWVLGAFLVAKAAKDRGKSFGNYLALGIFTSWVVSLIALSVARSKDAAQHVFCPDCAETIQLANATCASCGKTF